MLQLVLGKTDKMKRENKIIKLFIATSILFAQEFKLQFSSIPTGQGIALGDSSKVLNSIGGFLSQESSSESFKVGDGFLKSSQNIFQNRLRFRSIIFQV